jgi:hypothetical protein
LLADLMPFGRRAVIQLEHGGENLAGEHYETVAYWYGLPAPSLVRTDALDIGNPADEKKHAYASPQASSAGEITSRYEWGIDTFPEHPWVIPGRTDTVKPDNYRQYIGKQVYPPHTQDGRFTRGTSEFTVKVDPANQGVLLRRTLDYSFPNQKAEVFVADARDTTRWVPAGIWYTAGSNTCVYSFPPGELDPRQYQVRTSNRRFREEEFLLPRQLTQKRSALRIRIRYVPVAQELYPGKPFPKAGAWSELGYQVYSYVVPNFKP